MSPPRLNRWGRIAVVALIWGAAALSAARPARAAGCHAPERPVLGLTSAWDADETLVHTPAGAVEAMTPAFAPTPCSNDLPGSTPRVDPAPPAALTIDFQRPPAGEGSSKTSRAPVVRPRRLADRLDRPPRPVADGPRR